MSRSPNLLIEQLSADLTPVRVLRLRDGVVLVSLAVVITVLLVAWTNGLWMAGLAGEASPFFFIGNGLLLVLGASATIAVLTMASPQVGNRYDGPKWALAMGAVLPLAAFVTLFARGGGHSPLSDSHGPYCLLAALAASLLVAVPLIVWLRRGAPVSPNLAGCLTGVAATAFGSAAYGLSCLLDGMMHIGIWHAAPVAIGAIVGRFALPPLLRW